MFRRVSVGENPGGGLAAAVSSIASFSWSSSSSEAIQQVGLDDEAMARSIFRSAMVKHERRQESDGDQSDDSDGCREHDPYAAENRDNHATSTKHHHKYVHGSTPPLPPSSIKRSGIVKPTTCATHRPLKKSCRAWIRPARPIRQQSSLEYPSSGIFSTAANKLCLGPEFNQDEARSIFRPFANQEEREEVDIPSREGSVSELLVSSTSPRADFIAYEEDYCNTRDDSDAREDNGGGGVMPATPVRSSSVTVLTAEMSACAAGLGLPNLQVTTAIGGDQVLEWTDAVENSDVFRVRAVSRHERE